MSLILLHIAVSAWPTTIVQSPHSRPLALQDFFPEACVANTFLQGMQNIWHDQDFRLNLGAFGASAQRAHILAFCLLAA